MQTETITFWLGEKNKAIYCRLQRPMNDQINDMAIIICNATGHEYTHSHMSIRHLATQLTNDGYTTVRFDYLGTGNSCGDAFSPMLIETWLSNIDHIHQLLKKSYGIKRICLLGLRMGASLAALYADQQAVDKLILWNPCIKGKAYIREALALSQLNNQANHTDGRLDSGGTIITAQTIEDYKKIDLFTLNYRISENMLTLRPDELRQNDAYTKHLQSKGIENQTVYIDDYDGMMQRPQYSTSPKKSISHIRHWLQHTSQSTTINTTSKHTAACTIDIDDLQEVICSFGDRQTLSGILCQPNTTDPSTPVIVIPNTGAAHHVGPNRLHVELARDLAKHGFASLRFDLGNIGDSASNHPDNENHPYPEHANQDMRAAIAFLKNTRHYQRFIPAGLCSGANAAFHCALNNGDLDIPEAILINPLIFYWREGLSLDTPKAVTNASDTKYYKSSLKNPKKWLKLVTGKVNLIYIAQFLITLIKHRLQNKLLNIAEYLHLKEPPKLAKDLINCNNLNRHLSFFISANDPGYDLLISQARSTAKQMIAQSKINVYFFNDADHTFITFEQRQQFIETFIQHLKTRYPKQPTQ